jgi:hypothetical protein
MAEPSVNAPKKSRRLLIPFLLGGVLLVTTSPVGAGTIIGTPKNEVLRGTAKADKMYGRAGNDKLYGLAGNDLLVGGPGNDLLVGGPGGDTVQCGPGRDTVQATEDDKVAVDCEVLKGLPKPALSIADASAAEGNAGVTTMTFTVARSAPAIQAVLVSYSTADATATAPVDYSATSGRLTFAPGETSKTIRVAIAGDTTYETDETFTVLLSNPVNATIADGSATGTIQNDDPPDRVFGNGVRGGMPGVVGEAAFAFDAQAAGAAATGHYQTRSQTSRTEIDVKCLVVAGKKAAIGGVVQEVNSESNSGVVPGTLFVAWIQDGGPGAGDQMSPNLFFSKDGLPTPFDGVTLPPTFPAVCPGADVPGVLAFLPVISGDLTVIDEP